MGILALERAGRFAVVSGIPADSSGGTGRLVAHLHEQVKGLAPDRIELIARPERLTRWQLVLWLREKAYWQVVAELLRYVVSLGRFWWGICRVFFEKNRRLILLHPQNLGYRLTLRLIESRSSPPLIYLLDSSFFCIASYNHLRGEHRPCLRCLEHGFDEVKNNSCLPFPRPDWSALAFAPRLLELVKAGRVNIAAQNMRQAELAQRHFGLPERPRVVGLWTQDWDDVFAELSIPSGGRVSQSQYSWDVLFHGHCLDAKGTSWVAEVALRCPELRFMFPSVKPDWFNAGDNCNFVPCSWESGLKDEIRRARFVVVPSLWSAPIEGALVKSIVYAEATLVVDNPTSFCDELPEGVVLKLSADPVAGAEDLRHALRADWRPDATSRTDWVRNFTKNKACFAPSLLRSASAVHDGPPRSLDMS